MLGARTDADSEVTCLPDTLQTDSRVSGVCAVPSRHTTVLAKVLRVEGQGQFVHRLRLRREGTD